ncbi:UNVERIFIED_CONTAM: Zinc finger protein ZAT9 [Sesamum radiatum]|uniref:Zinc finger protein ZAT9 n=1 Tax=Sesamum radiatum TaxID=300843 RepID=A0AAW2VLH3_SESRA
MQQKWRKRRKKSSSPLMIFNHFVPILQHHRRRRRRGGAEEEEVEEDEEEEEEESGELKKALLSYELRENPRKSTVLVDHEFSSVVLQDRESETESYKKDTVCRRSKRVRKSRNSGFDGFSMNMNGPFFQVKKSKFEIERKSKNNHHEYSSLVEPEPLSSISDTTPEEHVAHCLIMLSRDKWRREEKEYQEEEEEGKFENDYSEDSGVQVKVIKTKVRGKYRCEACNKLFRSYQALGGHRASHKKIKPITAVDAPPQVVEKIGGSKAVVRRRYMSVLFVTGFSHQGRLLGSQEITFSRGGSNFSKC